MKTKCVLVLTLACVCLLAIVSPTAFGQASTATVLGTVTDASGAIVPGATLTARNVDTNQTRTAVSGGDGVYRFDALPVGNYSITATQTGFKAVVKSGLTFTVAQQAVVDFQLQVGEITQQVEVSAAAVQQVDTTSHTLGAVVDEHQVVDLPLNGRNYVQLALLQSGITEQKNRVQDATANLASQGTFYSSNGAPTRSNRYLLDGTNLSEYGFATASSISGTTLGIDGIREFKILSNSFDAEYGMAMGSQMLVVSKGGTNSFHGDAFDYLRNSAMNARNFFDTNATAGLTAAGAQRRIPPFRQNNFGAALGGPIKKDKTFFFGVYEGIREIQAQQKLTNTIPNGCRGDLAGDPITSAQCPYITGTTSANPNYACSFEPPPNTTIISCNVDPRVIPWLQPNLTAPAGAGLLFPISNSNHGAQYQTSWSFNEITKEDYGQMRVDHTFSAKDNLFVRYTIDNDQVSLPGGQPGFVQYPLSRGQWGTIAENHIFSPTLLNTVTFGYSRSNIWLGSPVYYSGPAYEYFTTNAQNTPSAALPGQNELGPTGYLEMGSLSIGGTSSATAGDSLFVSDGKQSIYSYSDDVYLTKGIQSIKFGTLINHYQIEAINGTNSTGGLSFSTMQQFLTGLASSVGGTEPGWNDRKDIRFDTLGFYIQDDIRANARWTFNAGIRYEPNTNMRVLHGLGTAVANPLIDASPTTGSLMMEDPSKNNWSPRVGFAWDPFGDGKTAIRGGVSYLQNVATWIGFLHLSIKELPEENPFSTPAPVTSIGELYTLPFTLPAASSLTSRTPTTYQYYPGANGMQPRGVNWNFSIQRQLPWGMAATVAYTGSRNLGLVTYTQGNPTIPNGVPALVNGQEECVPRAAGTPNIAIGNMRLKDLESPNTCFLSPTTAVTAPTYPATLATSGCPANPGPWSASGGYCPDSWFNQNWGNISELQASGQSWYNSIQASLEKRLQRGLQFQAAFTYSRLFDTTESQSSADAGSATSTNQLDPLHPEGDRSPATFDVPITFRFNLIYTTPTVHGNRFLSGLASGWRISPIFQAQSGSAFDVSVSERSLPTATGGSPDRPDVLPGRNKYNITHGTTAGCSGVTAGQKLGTPTLYFDPCAFYVQPLGFYGDEGRDWLRGPNYKTLDLSFVKDVRAPFLGEAGMFEFRAEGFNILNRVNLGTPNRSSFSLTGNSTAVFGSESPLPGATNPVSAVSTAGQFVAPTLSQSRQIQLVLRVNF